MSRRIQGILPTAHGLSHGSFAALLFALLTLPLIANLDSTSFVHELVTTDWRNGKAIDTYPVASAVIVSAYVICAYSLWLLASTLFALGFLSSTRAYYASLNLAWFGRSSFIYYSIVAIAVYAVYAAARLPGWPIYVLFPITVAITSYSLRPPALLLLMSSRARARHLIPFLERRLAPYRCVYFLESIKGEKANALSSSNNFRSREDYDWHQLVSSAMNHFPLIAIDTRFPSKAVAEELVVALHQPSLVSKTIILTRPSGLSNMALELVSADHVKPTHARNIGAFCDEIERRLTDHPKQTNGLTQVRGVGWIPEPLMSLLYNFAGVALSSTVLFYWNGSASASLAAGCIVGLFAAKSFRPFVEFSVAELNIDMVDGESEDDWYKRVTRRCGTVALFIAVFFLLIFIVKVAST